MNTSKQVHDAKLIQWISFFQEQAGSGLTVSDWCQEKGLSKHAFYYWKRQAKEAYVDSLEPDIVPLQLEMTSPESLYSEPALDSNSSLYNLANSRNSFNTDSLVSISAQGIHVDIEPSAPDALITKIIEVIRHA